MAPTPDELALWRSFLATDGEIWFALADWFRDESLDDLADAVPLVRTRRPRRANKQAGDACFWYRSSVSVSVRYPHWIRPDVFDHLTYGHPYRGNIDPTYTISIDYPSAPLAMADLVRATATHELSLSRQGFMKSVN